MALKFVIVLAVITVVTSVTLRPETVSTDATTQPNNISEAAQQTSQEQASLENAMDAMATSEPNLNSYGYQSRAAKVVQHYLNTRFGSPFRVFMLQSVHSGNAEDSANSGLKYQLEISMQEIISESAQKCSAEVLFPKGEKSQSAQVQATCEELLKINTTAQEEALYQQYKTNKSLVSAQNLPDSYGHIEPDMKPLWHLGIVASSFIMLNQSNQDTLYNMAQVANITQLASESDQLKFDCHVLLHEMVSQEIIHWKLLFTWSPADRVKVLQMEKLGHCHECEKPPNTD